MLHEILIALLGEVGGIIEEVNGVFVVREDCNLLTKSEKELINRILKAAGFFKYLQRFTEKYGALNVGIRQDEEELSGLYLKAMCRGIKDLLEEYRHNIASIEQEYLQERAVTIPSLLEKIKSEELGGVLKLVVQVENRKMRGGQLLDIVSIEERCPSMKELMHSIHYKILQVFFHQLIAWCVHGDLSDTYHEFFIKEQEGDEWTNKFTLDLDMLPETVISASQAEKVLFIGKAIRVLAKSISNDEVLSFVTALREVQYNFSKLLLAQVLERIRKTVGKKLWNLVVIDSNLQQHIIALKNYFLLSRGEFILTFLQESADLMALPPRPDTAETDINLGPFIQAQSGLEEDPYLSKFKFSIKQSGFNYEDFTYTNDLYQLANSKKMKHVMRLGVGRKAGAVWHNRKHPILPGFSCHLSTKGTPPFNLTFMIQSEKEISGQHASAPVYSENIENGLVVNFTLNAGVLKIVLIINTKSIAEVEKKYDKNIFKIVIYLEQDRLKVDIDNSLWIEKTIPISSIKLDVGGSAYVGLSSSSAVEISSWAFIHIGVGVNTGVFDSWSGLTLKYTPKPPINLMLSPQILDKYMTLFSFLFSLKRAQFVLHRAWLNQAKSKIVNKKALHLISQMSFFLDNFMSYLQVDVIEAHFSYLKKILGESDDFEEVRKHHEQYVAGIAIQCFLHAPRVVREVQEIARCSHLLSDALAKGGILTDLENDFDRHSKEVFKILSSYKNQHPALGQLLLRLNFNGYYSNRLASY
jgi:uncharacterized protein YsxB (DUF464 family)